MTAYPMHPGARSRPAAPPPALVVAAHGSRDPRALATALRLLERVRALRPGLPVHLGHIELNAPLLPDTLDELAASGAGSAVLVPLLFGRGHHVTRDIPDAAAAAPLPTRVAAPLGAHPLLVDALHARLTEAGWQPPQDAEERRRSAVVLAAAGSRAPASRADTERIAALLAARIGVPVVPAYASAAAPTVPEAVRALAARGRARVAVASCFTAPGRFAAECADAAPGTVADPLGTHPAMARLLLHRYDQALRTAAPVTGPAALATA
ncbi:sirohydrochlorin chelatase [Streptomyces cellulosae]|nr:sirohydrochlorin chelatase [Streptomyces cellulosae]WSB84336.1 sirohydrochlorin chelatase [Streptomyces cellulosae]WTB69203.1 sirohydrochlorin chelatase [Streptomyces cellulosae]WUC42269.1 sirohydrochlorin chelatase [Streptomyces cellulosae]